MGSSLSVIVVDTLTNDLLIESGWRVGQRVVCGDSPYCGFTLEASDDVDVFDAFDTPAKAQAAIDQCKSSFVGVTFKVVTYGILLETK